VRFQAHEVRNPLSVAVAALRFASSAIGDEAAPGVRSDLQVVSSSLEYIDDLLTGMLDLSRVAAGKIHLHPERCSLVRDVLTPVVQMLGGGSSVNRQEAASAPVLEVDEAVLQGDPLMVKVDVLRLKQVCVNLTKNALKFVPSGFVRLGAKRTSDDMVEVWVEDSGPGIPHAKAESLFEKFTQLHAHDKGTGIGLALCREIADAMGGTIEVDTAYTSGNSTLGPGARFVLYLPLMPAAEVSSSPRQSSLSPSSFQGEGGAGELPTAPAAVVRSTSGDGDDTIAAAPAAASSPNAHRLRGPYRALIVATDSAARQQMSGLIEPLKGESWRTIESSSGDRTSIITAAPVDLVILHHPASEAVVLETVASLQGSKKEGTDLASNCKPIVAVVVDAKTSSESTEESWKEAGAELVWCSGELFPTPAEAALALSTLLPLPVSWRVLAVDDVAMVRKLLERTLKAALGSGCQVVEAANSGEALAAIKASSAEGKPFDLIVLDEHLHSEPLAAVGGGGGGGREDFNGDESLKGTDLARRLRAMGSTAVIAGFSGDNMEDKHLSAGCDLSWRKTITSTLMSAELLQFLRDGVIR
jgi:CheY-like chemotaxis protein